MEQDVGPTHRGDAVGRAVVFGVFWFVAAFFFCGELGKWLDDWGFHARDSVTGAADWGRVFSLDPLGTRFWRPLHIHAAMFLQTAFWNHDWATHLALAVVHGVNALLLWKVLGRVCASRQAPAIGALLFLVYPAGHEAIFWCSTVGTPASVCGLLVCVLGVQKLATGEIGAGRLMVLAPVLLTLGWWYEQGAAVAPVMALIYLASVRGAWRTRHHVRVAVAVFGMTMAAGMVCAGLMVLTAPATARGGASSIVTAAQLPEQAQLIVHQAWRYATLREFAGGALAEGWRALVSRPAESVLVGGVLAIALVLFGRWWMRGEATRDAGERVGPTAGQRAMVALAGAGIVVGSMAPPIAIHGQWFASRLAYTPAIGAAMVLVAALDVLLSAAWVRGRGAAGASVRAGALAVLLGLCGCGAVMLAGVQSVLHARAAVDRRMAGELVRLVPEPARDAVFVPLMIRGLPTSTGSPVFDLIGAGPFEFAWSSPLFVRFAYHRSDLNGLVFARWQPPRKKVARCEGASEAGVHLAAGVLPASPSYGVDELGRMVVPWEKVVGIRVIDGNVSLVDAVRVEGAELPEAERVVRLREGTSAPEVMNAASVPAGSRKELAWRLTGEDGKPPAEQQAAAAMTALGHTYVAFTMHPTVEGVSGRSVLRAEVEGTEKEGQLALRVGMLDHVLAQSDGVRVTVAVEGTGTLAQETVTPEMLKRHGGWMMVRASLPASAAARVVTVRIDPGPAKNANYDWCVVTPPVLIGVGR